MIMKCNTRSYNVMPIMTIVILVNSRQDKTRQVNSSQLESSQVKSDRLKPSQTKFRQVKMTQVNTILHLHTVEVICTSHKKEHIFICMCVSVSVSVCV